MNITFQFDIRDNRGCHSLLVSSLSPIVLSTFQSRIALSDRVMKVFVTDQIDVAKKFVFANRGRSLAVVVGSTQQTVKNPTRNKRIFFSSFVDIDHNLRNACREVF